jgi:predicted nuclease of predicted toxin-antitoxin system
MPWQTIPDPDPEEVARFRRARRSRFLIDESLGFGTVEFFERLRLNAVDVWQVGLNGRDDHAVFAFAWRHRRILLTHDEDFWDDRRFPEHRNPGLVILPGANGDETDMISGLWWMTQLMDCNPELWTKTKVRITRDGEVYVRGRDWRTGAMVTRRFRFARRRNAMEFVRGQGPARR